MNKRKLSQRKRFKSKKLTKKVYRKMSMRKIQNLGSKKWNKFIRT